MISYGDFAGKYTFATTDLPSDLYLTIVEIGETLRPAMDNSSVPSAKKCVLYIADATNEEYYMQLGSSLWLSGPDGADWLQLSSDFSQAIRIKLGGEPYGQEIYAIVDGSPQRVYYRNNSPYNLLLIDATATTGIFAPAIITPSLTTMRANGGANADLSNVNLSGADLSKINFEGANFSQANLTGANCDGANFTQASFEQATLTNITANGTTLDRSNFTEAILDGVVWGIPASAVGAIFTSCSAVGATLGDETQALDCSEAILTNGDFRDADLSNWNLANAVIGDALMEGTTLDNAMLDGANISNAVMLSASLRSASMQQVTAQGTNLINADLSYANLNQAQMGSRAFLFFLDDSFKDQLNTYAYPQNDLVAAFSAQGVTLDPNAPIVVLDIGERWNIDDSTNGPFSLNLDETEQIAVFQNSANLPPAILAEATCLGTQASSAKLAGADLRGVQWYAAPATLDHADLEGAHLNEGLFVQTDFTQAFISGADFSGSILVGTKFNKCLIAASSDSTNQPTSFLEAQLHSAEFTQANVLSATFYEANIATADGAPLFQLPLSDASILNSGDISALAPKFEQAGYPLGSNPTSTQQQQWNIDNSEDPDGSSPREYVVVPNGRQLDIFNGGDLTEPSLFSLDRNTYETLLEMETASPPLVAAFNQNGYSLFAQAPISSVTSGWQVEAGENQPFLRPTNYPSFRIQELADVLQVYGTSLLRLRDWNLYPDVVAFQETIALQDALSPSTIGPSGDRYSMVSDGTIDWIEYLTPPSQ